MTQKSDLNSGFRAKTRKIEGLPRAGGQQKSQANDLPRRTPNAHRPKQHRLSGWRKERLRDQVLAGPPTPPAATNAANAVKNATKKLRPKRRLKESDVNVVNKPMLRKALGGTIVGNTMEWYDVGVFGYLITTMGPVFLPEADPSVQTLFLLGTFAATFIARPLGGIVFGWLGDKVGRQKVLAATLMLMAASTFAVGLLPGYAQIGIWAAALLVILKLVQGFSTGGEYAGATTFVSEYAPDKRRGYFASFLDMGSYIASPSVQPWFRSCSSRSDKQPWRNGVGGSRS